MSAGLACCSTRQFSRMLHHNWTEIEAAGQSLGVAPRDCRCLADEAALENAFAWLNEQQIRGLLISGRPPILGCPLLA